jgi:hypothetical protein
VKADPTQEAFDGNTLSPAVVATALYPLRFEPIYQYRLWGGRGLAGMLDASLPSGPIGEAWIVSDRDDHASVRRGDVVLLPARLGRSAFRPNDTVTLLEIALPEASTYGTDEAQP